MNSGAITLLIYMCVLRPSVQNVCTDLGSFPQLVNNYTMGGSLILAVQVQGLLHCVEECKSRTTCKAFTYSLGTGECQMYPRFGYSSNDNTGPVLFSSISDWTKEYSDSNNGPEESPKRGYDCYVMRGSLAYYNGTKSVTPSGSTCQRWDSQTPHEHIYGTEASDFETGETMDEVSNYCRVSISDGEPTPWCYTTSIKRWELCDIPECLLT